MNRFAAISVAVLLSASGTAFAQAPAAPQNMPANAASTAHNISRADRSFATKAAQGGLAEVEEAQLAEKQGTRQDVKDFAQRMVTDHTKANDQLKSIASSEGITLPSDISKSDQSKLAKLQALNGKAFDTRYVQYQRSAHKSAVALFTKESKNGTNDQLKSFAGQTLPILQDHLQMITSMPTRS